MGHASRYLQSRRNRRSAFAALNFLHQFSAVAEAALELSPDIATEFIDWIFKR
jgi:hypothetical protein